MSDGASIWIRLVTPRRTFRWELVKSPPAGPSAQPEASHAVEELAGDLQMTRMRRSLLDYVQDHHADAGYLLTAVAAARHVGHADAGEYLVRPVTLLPIIAEHIF